MEVVANTLDGLFIHIDRASLTSSIGTNAHIIHLSQDILLLAGGLGQIPLAFVALTAGPRERSSADLIGFGPVYTVTAIVAAADLTRCFAEKRQVLHLTAGVAAEFLNRSRVVFEAGDLDSLAALLSHVPLFELGLRELVTALPGSVYTASNPRTDRPRLTISVWKSGR